MPKKKRQVRSQRAPAAQRPRPAPEPEREPGILQRIRKNPFGVLLALIIISSMVLGLAADIVQNTRPQPLPPIPTPIVYDTPERALPTPETTKGENTVTPFPTPSRPTPSSTAARKTYAAPPPMSIDVAKQYTATIVTGKGTIKLQLLPDVAPNTVNAFVALARDGYYDGLTFHRVEDWVVQGGDPTGTGSGGPGYTLKAEFNQTKHVPGTLAMARTNDPNSAGSQFYIVKSAASWLDGQYTVFGQTIEGIDVVGKLTRGDVMQKITIEEK